MVLTIRPAAEEEELIKKLKAELGVKTSSKALLLAGERFLGVSLRLRVLEKELEMESKSLLRANQAIGRYLSALNGLTVACPTGELCKKVMSEDDYG